EFIENEIGIVGIDTKIDEKLEIEALVRELIRHIQEERKKEKLKVNQKISLEVDCSSYNSKIKDFKEIIEKEVNAKISKIGKIDKPKKEFMFKKEKISFFFEII
ncbi:MAG: hypothetical protein B6U78_02365, partial [Candidatus Aenigmarchaeota archaeon ex4484_224]